MVKILLTGGAGYIGTHTITALADEGHDVIVVDNLSNSSRVSLERVEQITGVVVPFFETDLSDESALDAVFADNQIDAVIHFAGLKAVDESVGQPLLYYQNNIGSTLVLCKVMLKHNVKNLIFSSSATVYGDPATVPISENFPLSATNPYGQTKLMIEQILHDICVADPTFYVTCLRYFNPVGAHPSGQIGEDPRGVPNNLVPYVAQVAVGKREKLKVFGNDYPTTDGTGVRDYIHVSDLALGHVAALKRINDYSNWEVYNLGSGSGSSVLEVISAFEQASGKEIPYEIVERRPGDIAACYADPSKANQRLDWKTKRNLAQACADSWNWQSKNPNGFVN